MIEDFDRKKDEGNVEKPDEKDIEIISVGESVEINDIQILGTEKIEERIKEIFAQFEKYWQENPDVRFDKQERDKLYIELEKLMTLNWLEDYYIEARKICCCVRWEKLDILKRKIKLMPLLAKADNEGMFGAKGAKREMMIKMHNLLVASLIGWIETFYDYSGSITEADKLVYQKMLGEIQDLLVILVRNNNLLDAKLFSRKNDETTDEKSVDDFYCLGFSDKFRLGIDQKNWLNLLTELYKVKYYSGEQVCEKVACLLQTKDDLGRNYEELVKNFGQEKWKQLIDLIKNKDKNSYQEFLLWFETWLNWWEGSLYHLDKVILENELLKVVGDDLDIVDEHDKETMKLLIAESAIAGEHEYDLKNIKIALDKFPELLEQNGGDWLGENILHKVNPYSKYSLEIAKEVLSRVDYKMGYLNQQRKVLEEGNPMLARLFDHYRFYSKKNDLERVEEMIKLFLVNGTDPNLADVNGNTCLHYLFDGEDGGNDFFIGLKQCVGRNIKMVGEEFFNDNSGETLDEADYRKIKEKNLFLVDLILQYGGDLSVRNMNGDTPWDLLAKDFRWYHFGMSTQNKKDFEEIKKKKIDLENKYSKKNSAQVITEKESWVEKIKKWWK